MLTSAGRALLLTLAVVGAAPRLPAQQVSRLTAPARFTLDQWTTIDGLPQNSVNAIAQTPDGYIWVGTFGGLARFDGIRFNVIERIDSAGRHVDRVLALAVSPDSSLWIGTENGLLQYRDHRFRRFTEKDGLPDHQIRALFVDHTGVLWAGAEHTGAAHYQAGRFVAVRRTDGTPVNGVVSFAEDHNGVLWLNGLDTFYIIEHGLAVDARERDFATTNFQHMLLEDHTGAHWFLERDGLTRVNAGRTTAFSWGFGPEVMVAQEEPGRYWLGTFGSGVLEFDATTNTRTAYPLAGGTSNYGTRVMVNGRDGNVWAGTTSHGLLRMKQNLFTTYRAANGLSHDVVTPVMETRDGSLWVGTNCGGLNVLDAARQTVTRYKAGPPGVGKDPCIFSLAQDSAGAVWVGTYGGGLTRIIDGRTERLGGLGALKDSVILALYTDKRGTLWVGMNAGGLAEVRNGQVRRIYTTADGLASNSVRTIAAARDGSLWIGTLEGLSRLRADGHITSFTAKDGLSSEYVRAIYEDADGSTWIGTYGGGLNRLRDGKFVSITRADGLPDNVVSSIIDDGRGYLWMTGNRGIFRVAREQLRRFAAGELHRVHTVLYGQGDGLVKAETNGGFQPAAWKDRNGRLWFPTIEGLATVDPAAAIAAPRPPPVTIEEVLVDGERRSPEQTLQVGPGRPNVEFRYTAVSLTSPENETFRYRLEGLDDHWVEPGTRRVAYYSRLPAGHYRFIVTAANRDGAWNPVETSMAVVVLAPLFLRPWFLSLVLASLGLALWTSHRAVLRTRSDAIRDERSRLAREIHDSLLQGFGGIALQLHAAMERLALPPAQQPALDRILTTIDRTLKQAREAVWDIRPTDSDAPDFSIDCENAAQRVLVGSRTIPRIETRGRTRALSAVSRTECMRIVEEALTNVRKHADAEHATVDLEYGWRRLRLTITDDGRGFDLAREGSRPGHWGCLGMRERASRIGARLTLHSTPGSGTVVSLTVPYSPGLFARFTSQQPLA